MSVTSLNCNSATTWATLGAILIGIVLLLLPAPEGLPIAAQRTAAVSVVMAILWIALPDNIPAVSLIPLAAYPLLGIAGAKKVCLAYADSNVFLYLGGFIIGFRGSAPRHSIRRFQSAPLVYPRSIEQL